MADALRLHVFFSGYVQGVGFRFTTRHIARDFKVCGFVRNLPDGRVELVAEGAPEEVRRFVARVRETMRHYIHKVDLTEEPATGEFDAFRIAY